MIGIFLSYILAYISYISSQKKDILSFQQQTDSNCGKHLHVPYILSEDFLCETQGAGLHVREWKILIRNETIS